MMVSGPSHNKALWQAQQIALFALTVVQEVKDFMIPHRPHSSLRLRVAINAGSAHENYLSIIEQAVYKLTFSLTFWEYITSPRVSCNLSTCSLEKVSFLMKYFIIKY